MEEGVEGVNNEQRSYLMLEFSEWWRRQPSTIGDVRFVGDKAAAISF